MYQGGSWLSFSDNCRSASRHWLTPDYRYNSMGFRVLRSSAEEVKYRVNRGGSCHGYSALCRSANRHGNSPVNRNRNLGFRIIKENKHAD